MWQPNRAQWSIIWTVAIVLIAAWPPEKGRSLGVTTLNWAVDPAGSLPTMPAQLPMSLDDNGDAVAAHDAELSEYYRLHASSTMTRVRMDLKTATDPFDPITEREILVGLGILSALAVWRLSGRG
jgi:hypothetical protein